MTAAALELDLVGRVAERLRAKIERAALPTVETALQLGEKTPPKIPAAVVYLAADDASDNVAPAAGAFQRVTAVLAVVHVIAARNTPRSAGGPAVDPLAQLTGRTRAVLNGWRPDESPRQDAIALRRGRLLEIADGRAIWQDEYTVSWRAASVQDD